MPAFEPPPVEDAPGAPANLAFQVSGSTVILTWSPPGGGGAVASYVLEAGTAAGQSNVVSFATGSTATTFTATGVPNGTYFVRVRARNADGTSGPSNEVSITVGGGGGPCPTPSAPTGFTASASGNTVTLTWNATAGALSFIIEAGTAPGAVNIITFDTGSAATSFTGSAPNGTYYLRVRVRTSCGVSAASNEATLTIGPSAPGPVLGPEHFALIPGRVWEFDNGTVITALGNPSRLEFRDGSVLCQVEYIEVGPSGLLQSREDRFVSPTDYRVDGCQGPGLVEAINTWDPPQGGDMRWGMRVGETGTELSNEQIHVPLGRDGVVPGGCATMPWTTWRFVQQRHTTTIEAQERIAVPAGTFDTLRIRTVTEETNNPFNSCGSTSRNVVTFWVAPNVGFVQFQDPGESPMRLVRRQ